MRPQTRPAGVRNTNRQRSGSGRLLPDEAEQLRAPFTGANFTHEQSTLITCTALAKPADREIHYYHFSGVE